MYCPQCGQQQVSDVTRFCSRCGFLLDGVAAVLATGGTVPAQYVQVGYKQLSPRSKGVRQGAMLMLSTILVVPLISVISVFILGHPEIIVPITAMICFIGGLLRILYALIMEEAISPVNFEPVIGYPGPAAAQFARPMPNAALPSASVNAAPSWRRPHTAEIYQPPSVTENTTRLLDKDEKKNG